MALVGVACQADFVDGAGEGRASDASAAAETGNPGDADASPDGRSDATRDAVAGGRCPSAPPTWELPGDVKQNNCGGLAGDGRDSDGDGIPDRAESKACDGPGADPEEGDTDGDDLSDCEEAAFGTSPCESDTDGDGFSDRAEATLRFDPTDPESPRPSESWILSACDADWGSADITTVKSDAGFWTYFHPRDAEVRRVVFRDRGPRESIAVIDAKRDDAAGALLTWADREFSTPPSDVLRNRVSPALSQIGQMESLEEEEPRVDSAWQQPQVSATADLRASTPLSTAELRRRIALEIVPFERSDFEWPGEEGGTSHRRFRLYVTILKEETPDLSAQAECWLDDGKHRGDSDTQILFAVAPRTDGSSAAVAARRLASPTRHAPTPKMSAFEACDVDFVACPARARSAGTFEFPLTREAPIAGTIRARTAATPVDASNLSFDRAENRLAVDWEAWPSERPDDVRRSVAVTYHSPRTRCRPPM